MWTPVIVVLLLLFGSAAFWFATSWRAADLATKALHNAESGNLRMARLQVESARRLRPGDARVLGVAAVVETIANNPAAPAVWDALPQDSKLDKDHLRRRADAMTRFGSDHQHQRSLDELESAGLQAEAFARRAERRRVRGDLALAIENARAARTAHDTPEHRFFLLRLLAARHGPLLAEPQRMTPEDAAAMLEIIALVDSLSKTQLRNEALNLGVRAPLLPYDRRVAWSRAALEDLRPSNPALLPAAYALRDFGEVSLDELRARLTIPFLDAPLSAQAAFADFLISSKAPEAALEAITAKEALRDGAAFDSRARALAACGRWNELLELADGAGNVSEALRELTRAQAAAQLGRSDVPAKSVPLAIRAASREGSLRLALDRADAIGAANYADGALVDLCGDAPHADHVFALARERFARRARLASLDEAFRRAVLSGAKAPSVRNYQLYLELLSGAKVDPAETEVSLLARPTQITYRITHALALLRAGQPHKAWAAFDDLTAFFQELEPGYQAVICAILAAKGQTTLAQQAAADVDVGRLSPAEYLLIARLRTAG